MDGVSIQAEDGKKTKKSKPVRPAAAAAAPSTDAETSQPLKDYDYQWAEGLFDGYVPGLLENSNKIQIFLKILDETLRAGDRLLLFSQSLLTLNLIETFLQQRTIPGTQSKWVPNINYYRLDGSTPALERERLINSFNGVHYDGNPTTDISLQPLLFLVSTRAGSLGVNLIGANRVVVFDASWNPCHDSQAVCRVYRYGQFRTSFIYRLVTDSTLERRIYDRQINKQGMSNRVVDEMNPDAHMHSKDMNSLLCLEEDEQVGKIDKKTGQNIPVDPQALDDSVLAAVLSEFEEAVTTQPFQHDSLLIDRREKRLSAAEKRLAERSFAIEKGAKISYKRSSYAAFYPEAQTSKSAVGSTINTGIQGHNVPIVNGKPSELIRNSISVPSVGLQLSRNNYSSYYKKDSAPTTHHPNYPPQHSASKFPFEALAKQGVNIQEVTVPKNVQIPTNTNGHPPIALKAGQKIMLIQTPKGIYLRLNEQIIKIKLPQSLVSLFTQNGQKNGDQVAAIFQLAQKSTTEANKSSKVVDLTKETSSN